MRNTKPQIFVWRDWLDQAYINRSHWEEDLYCLYCKTELHWDKTTQIPRDQDVSVDTASYTEATCNECGWVKRKWVSWHTAMPGIRSDRWITHKGLRSFKITDPRIAISELAAHINRRYADIHSITPRQFEELVAAVFRSMGWGTRLTKQSRDGGIDIYLFEDSSQTQAIVECKRYKNKVGIGIVDRLLGVQLARGFNKAFLVTSSEFTKPAVEQTKSPFIKRSGFELTLFDAEQLARALGVFNEALPPLYLSKGKNG